MKWKILIVTVFGVFMVILDATVINVAVARLESVFGAGLTSVQWVLSVYTLALGVTTPLARVSRGPARYQENVSRRPRHLRRRLGALGRSAVASVAHRCAHVAGRGRRHCRATRFGAALRRVSARRARTGARRVWSRTGRRAGARPRSSAAGSSITTLGAGIFWSTCSDRIAGHCAGRPMAPPAGQARSTLRRSTGSVRSCRPSDSARFSMRLRSRVAGQARGPPPPRWRRWFSARLRCWLSQRLNSGTRDTRCSTCGSSRRAQFTIAALIGWISIIARSSVQEFLLPLYLQTLRGRSAMQAGLALLPLALASAVVVPLAGWAYDKIRRASVGGLRVCAARTQHLGALRRLTYATPMRDIVFLPFVVRGGVALGTTVQATQVTALSALETHELARGSHRSSMRRRQTLQSVGVAALATVVTATTPRGPGRAPSLRFRRSRDSVVRTLSRLQPRSSRSASRSSCPGGLRAVPRFGSRQPPHVAVGRCVVHHRFQSMAEKRRLPVIPSGDAPADVPGEEPPPPWHWVPLGAVIMIGVGAVLAKSFYVPYVQRCVGRGVRSPSHDARVRPDRSAAERFGAPIRCTGNCSGARFRSRCSLSPSGDFVVGRFGARTNQRHGTLAGIAAMVLLLVFAGRGAPVLDRSGCLRGDDSVWRGHWVPRGARGRGLASKSVSLVGELDDRTT